MKTKAEKAQQAQEYIDLVKSVFPDCLYRFANYHDDIYSGLEIAPEPGVLILFKWKISDKYCIRIEVLYSYASPYVNPQRILIINGPIPSDSNYEPDFDFIEKILKNYKLFSI
jgi:hypothetical protein